jgi:hypothetical protein
MIRWRYANVPVMLVPGMMPNSIADFATPTNATMKLSKRGMRKKKQRKFVKNK